MVGRFFLGVLLVASLLWLGYSTYDGIVQKKQFDPRYLFNETDQSLLIIQSENYTEKLIELMGGFNSEMLELSKQINTEEVSQLFLSAKRNHLLIISQENLNPITISNLFKQKIQVDKNSFSINGFHGIFDDNQVYLSQGDYPKSKEIIHQMVIDKNADASIINFQKGNSVTDIYMKENGVVSYKSTSDQEMNADKVDDKALFAAVIPAQTSWYEFYESDYLKLKHPEITQNPVSKWLNFGLLKLEMNEKTAVVCDYLAGQDPMQVLYDYFNLETNSSSYAYFSDFSLPVLLQEEKGLYVYKLYDFVIISKHSDLCEQIISDYKLGNTLSQHTKQAKRIYQGLPQKVNYRLVNNQEKKALSVYKNQRLLTQVNGSQDGFSKQNYKSENETRSFVVGSIIEDFLLINEHNIFVITADDHVVYFENGQKKWEKQLDSKIIGNAQIIDIYANDKDQLLVATNKRVHVFDVNGNEPSGFPIRLDDEIATQTPLFFRWKGSGFFVIPTNEGKLIQFDNQGRELKIVETKVQHISKKPLAWVSANKPFVGVYGNNHFEMLRAVDLKHYRDFEAKNIEVIMELPNEIKLYALDGQRFIAYDQRGSITKLEQFQHSDLHSTQNPLNGLVVQDGQELKLFNSKGIQWGMIKIPFTELADVQLFTLKNGSTIMTTIDAIANQVHVWNTDGSKFGDKSFDGSQSVHYFDGYLFTIIDKMIVRYALIE